MGQTVADTPAVFIGTPTLLLKAPNVANTCDGRLHPNNN
jgi:hypothetical protein